MKQITIGVSALTAVVMWQETIEATQRSAMPDLDDLALEPAVTDADGQLLLQRCDTCDRVFLASAHVAHSEKCAARPSCFS